MILAVSYPADDHAAAVLGALDRRGAEALLVDLSQFPQRSGLTLAYDGDERNFRLEVQGRALAAEDCRSVWWRRLGSYVPHPEIVKPSHQQFVFNECHAALSGFFQTLDARWMNHPTNEEVAAHKVLQLRVAQEVGLSIPRTLITNNPQRAQEFASERDENGTIYKAFTATEQEWRETRLLKNEERALLDNVRFAPVIFQEYVPADVDLRVTAVGDRLFAAAIHSQETSYKVDCRIDWAGARVEPATLPDEIESRLHRLMDRLGLVYGAIDLRRTPDGDHVFLEVNPSGQWLFIEARTGLPITEAVAAQLAAPS